MAERPSDKSPDAFRTISEVADHLDLPQHVLRFWETKFPEIRPVKRAGGRRFYRPEDVDLLRAIRHLLYTEGYTIKGVQKVLKDQGTRTVQAVGADLLDGRTPEDLRAPPPAPPQAKPAASGSGRGLLGGLLPRRREPRREAEFLSDSQPLFDREPSLDQDGLFGPSDAGGRLPGEARPERRDARDEPQTPGPRAPRARDARPARQDPAPLEPWTDEPGLPFGDDGARFGAPLPPPGFDDTAFDPPETRPVRARVQSDFPGRPADGATPQPERYPAPSGRADPRARAQDDRRADDWPQGERYQEDVPHPDWRREPLSEAPPRRDARPQPSASHDPRAPAPPVPAPQARGRDETMFGDDHTWTAQNWADPAWDPAPAHAPVPAAEPRPVPPRRADAAPPLRRPSRGPASRVPEPAPVPELEDPLLPFFDDDVRASEDDAISEPLDARIRRMKEHGVEEPVLRRRVGPLTGPFEDDSSGHDAYDDGAGYAPYGAPQPGYAPPEPRRQGPPEQYLPPHLRSEPRLTAAPVHPPQPVLSRDDMHRLQAALYELGECRRLLKATLDT